MYSTHNEGKSVIVERFIRTLKSKIYKYMTSFSKEVYIDKLDDTVNKYNNTYHSTIKMKPVDEKSTSYIDSSGEINDKDPKFKIGDIVRISKHNIKIFLQKVTLQISLKVFVIKQVKLTVLWTLLIMILMEKKLLELFTKKELQKTNQKFRIEKVIKRKSQKLYVKWKGYSNWFNSWIDKKDKV